MFEMVRFPGNARRKVHQAQPACIMVLPVTRIEREPAETSRPQHTYCPDCMTWFPSNQQHLCPFPSRL